jgi:hypothetical protein
MDPLENKIRAIYQDKKMQDEKLLIPFENLHLQQKEKKPRKTWMILKIAACISIPVLAVLLYYNNTKNTDYNETGLKIDLQQQLPSDSLVQQNPGVVYLWNWKAPTDGLLEEAKKTMRPGNNN